LNLVRAVAAQAASIGLDEPSRRIGLLLWGTLQTHKLMKEFIDARFRRHPTVAANLMLHLASIQVPSSKFEELQAEITASGLQPKMWIQDRKDVEVVREEGNH
jgi:hypothetical protein